MLRGALLTVVVDAVSVFLIRTGASDVARLGALVLEVTPTVAVGRRWEPSLIRFEWIVIIISRIDDFVDGFPAMAPVVIGHHNRRCLVVVARCGVTLHMDDMTVRFHLFVICLLEGAAVVTIDYFKS